MSIQIKVGEAKEYVTTAIQAKLVPMLHGSPAIGKSAIIQQIAQQFALKVIDLRLSQCDPTDLMGFPHINGHRAGYKPMDTFPIEGDPIPEGYNGWILFLDELNSAPLGVQAAAYKLILDRMVGQFHLHKNVAIVGAGNLETDGAIVQPMSTALQSRLVHLEVVPDSKQWIAYAEKAGFDDRITSYIEFRPDNLYRFTPDHTDKTYASPRTWEFINRLLKVSPDTKKLLPLMAGTIGEGVAREFYGYCDIYRDLPKIADVIRNPNSVPISKEPSVQYALCGSVAANATEENCEALLDFVDRLPGEFQIVCVRSMVRRNKKLMSVSAFKPWLNRLAEEVF